MDTILLLLIGAFALCLLIQLLFIWFVFARLSFAKTPEHSALQTHGEPLSIIVAARNEYENLQQLLPALLAQDHPNYEIIIVDDRSFDDSYDFLLEQSNLHERVKLVRVNDTPPHINGKKYALTLGIKAAKNEQLLFTDADCLPCSTSWAREMQASYQENTGIVIGFSPYEKHEGLLNIFIRYETFYVGLQYLSMAMLGKPFMAVGRNLSYKKTLFLQNKGYFKHKHITGGDDDLFINEVATPTNAAVAWWKNSQMMSIPKKTWTSWYRQKMRHLSVGQYYRSSNKFWLGLLSLSHLGTYILLASLIVLSALQLVSWWIPAGGYALRMLSQMIVFEGARRRIDMTQVTWLLPFLDLLYIFYYIFVGMSALGSKRTSWN